MKKEINRSWFDEKLSLTERFLVEVVFRNNISFPASGIEENELLELTLKNGLSGLLYQRLKDIRDYPFSTAFLSRLKNEYLKILLVNTHLIDAAKKIEALLHTNDIPVVFLKGILLAPFLYDEISLRPMSDIDLLVPEKVARKAAGVLLAHGAKVYDPQEKDQPLYHHLPMMEFNKAPLEIHRFLFPQQSLYFIPPDDIFQHKTNWKNNSFSLPGPSVDQLFIYMAVHVFYSFKRGGMRLSWMADFMLFMKKGFVKVDDDDFRYWVNKWKVKYPVEFILTLTDLLTGKDKIVFSGENRKMLTQDISLAFRFFSHPEEGNTSFSYTIVWEQIKNAKGIRKKYDIIKSKIYRKNDQGTALRTAHLFIRLSGMFYNSVKLRIKRFLGRY